MIPAEVNNIFYFEFRGSDVVSAIAGNDIHVGTFHGETIRLVAAIELTVDEKKDIYLYSK